VNDPAQLRRDYSGDELGDDARGTRWPDRLREWFDAAVADPAVVEPNAIQIATVNGAGRPSVRTVLVKGMDERGIVFYTNYGSAKAHDLDESPYAAAVFAWLPMARQVRLSGPVERVSREETQAYFATRPRGSQIAAWASEQSSVIGSRTGAAICSVRRWSSSGRAGRTAFTTGCATAASARTGSSSGSRRERWAGLLLRDPQREIIARAATSQC
jgi:pyridoxamine-phosphate oxidase